MSQSIQNISSKQTDIMFYAGVLRNEECHCGRAKKPKHALCYGCYKSLPFAMQRALWQQLCDGFEAAYEDAIKWLGP